MKTKGVVMKITCTFLAATLLSLGLTLATLGAEATCYLEWDDQLAPIPGSSQKNVLGENGEHLLIWTFTFDEVLIWQPTNPGQKWWDITDQAGYHYSSSGVAPLNFDTSSFFGFDDDEPFYVLAKVKTGQVLERYSPDYQTYSGWEIVYFDNPELLIEVHTLWLDLMD
jgi:hypothetical protein